jgi:hypothetical protein
MRTDPSVRSWTSDTSPKTFDRLSSESVTWTPLPSSSHPKDDDGGLELDGDLSVAGDRDPGDAAGGGRGAVADAVGVTVEQVGRPMVARHRVDAVGDPDGVGELTVERAAGLDDADADDVARVHVEQLEGGLVLDDRPPDNRVQARGPIPDGNRQDGEQVPLEPFPDADGLVDVAVHQIALKLVYRCRGAASVDAEG